MKKLISFILCMLMLLSLVPASAFAADTESETSTAYDLPEAGDVVKVLYTNTGEKAYTSNGAQYLLHSAKKAGGMTRGKRFAFSMISTYGG